MAQTKIMDKKDTNSASNNAKKIRIGGSNQPGAGSSNHASSADAATAVVADNLTGQASTCSSQNPQPSHSRSAHPSNSSHHDGNIRNHRGQRNHSANGVAGYLSANGGSGHSKSRNHRSLSQETQRERRLRDSDSHQAAASNIAVDEREPSPVPVPIVSESQEDIQPLDFETVTEAPSVLTNSSPPPLPLSTSPHLQHQSAADSLRSAAPYNWQSSKPVLKERLAFMFNNEIMADVHFLVGKGAQLQRIPAHKFVLAIGSAVFDAMFNGGMATTSDEVELPDVEPAAFLALLRFLYSDEVQIGPETVMTTLYTAKKYAVPALEKSCVDFLKRNLNSDNSFMLLTQARLFDEPQLAALCLETIDKSTTEALIAEGFTDIDLETLCVVLERDTLGIRESKLFTSVCRWAEAECLRQNLPISSENQRRVLGKALELIRFPLMTVEEFAMGSAQSGILQDREIVELFLYFTVNPKPTVQFLDTPRCCLTGKEQVVSRFCQIESRWGYSGTSDRIRSVYSVLPAKATHLPNV